MEPELKTATTIIKEFRLREEALKNEIRKYENEIISVNQRVEKLKSELSKLQKELEG